MGVPSSIHVFHKPYGHGRFDSESRIRQALGSNSVWGKVRLGQPKTPPAGGKLRFFRENLKNSIFPPFGPSTPGGSSGRALAAAEEAARLAKAGGRQDPTRAPSTPTRAAKRNRDVPTKALRRRANALPTPPRRDNRYKNRDSLGCSKPGILGKPSKNNLLVFFWPSPQNGPITVQKCAWPLGDGP